MIDRRRELIRIMARIEQMMAEAESITVGETDDDILIRATKLLREHRHMLAAVERKLRSEDRAG